MSPWRTTDAGLDPDVAASMLAFRLRAWHWQGYTHRTVRSALSTRAVPLVDLQCRRKKVTQTDER